MPKRSSALAWIIREAKTLRKKYPKRFRSWRDYVSQASAIYAKKKPKARTVSGKPKPVAGTDFRNRSLERLRSLLRELVAEQKSLEYLRQQRRQSPSVKKPIYSRAIDSKIRYMKNLRKQISLEKRNIF